MANSVVASWTACIKELQQLIDRAGEADASVAVAHAFHKRFDTLNQQPALPNAVWKNPVQDVKVTYALLSRLARCCLDDEACLPGWFTAPVLQPNRHVHGKHSNHSTSTLMHEVRSRPQRDR
jgi:hypothetical protein